MPKKNKSKNLSPEIIDHWPEVFEDLEIEAVPLEYLTSIMIYFNDGRIWEVNVAKEKNNVDSIEESIEALLQEYDHVIESVDFKLDTEKVKNDVSRRTKSFMKRKR